MNMPDNYRFSPCTLKRMWIVPFFTKYSLVTQETSSDGSLVEKYAEVTDKDDLTLLKKYAKKLNTDRNLSIKGFPKNVGEKNPHMEFRLETPFTMYRIAIKKLADGRYYSTVNRFIGPQMRRLYYTDSFSPQLSEQMWQTFAKP